MKKVAVVMGSDSDLAVLAPCFAQLKALGIPFEAHVYSAHRTPDEAAAFAASTAAESGLLDCSSVVKPPICAVNC